MPAPVRRRTVPAVLLALLLALVGAVPSPPAAAAAPVPAAAPALTDGIETASLTRPVAPGLSLTSFDRYGQDGWVRADALAADLAGDLEVDYVNAGAVARTAPLRPIADQTGAVAAVNGDFFDINNSGAAEGVGIRDGELIQSPVAGHRNAVAISAAGVGAVVEAFFEGTATGPAAEPVALTQFNNRIQAGGVGLFTALWGDYPRTRAVTGAGTVTEVLVTGGVVAQVSDQAGSGPIPAGSSVLLGREAGAGALAGLAVGDPVTIAYDARSSDGGESSTAIGGGNVLVRDGVPQPVGGTPEPRTAVGFSEDGETMYLVTVDGRQVDSRGATLTEMGELMVELGAHDALELDGGGSSTLVAREPGAPALQVENSPSDGSERHVPNGLAIYAPDGSGQVNGFWVETAADPATAPGLGPVMERVGEVGGGRPDRVFPGLTRTLTAAGYDETYGPAPATPRWHAERGTVDGGVFVAGGPGQVTVTAVDGGASGSIELTVLEPLARIAPTKSPLGLSGVDGTAMFGIVGSDAEGFTAPVEAADVTLTYDADLLEVTGDHAGWFTVRAKQDTGSATITATVHDVRTQIPVTVGLAEVVVADFADADEWFYNSIPADIPGGVQPAEGRDGRPGLRLTADFTRHTVTRAAYANPPGIIDVPGQPQAFTMGIHASGNAEWPSLHLMDANDTSVVLRGPNMTWTGWREVRFDVPPGIAYPVRIRRFYAPEIRAGAQYHSEWTIDEIAALLPPEVDLPQRLVVPDPVVAAELDDPPWRFAVMADAQFTADNPDSDIVAQTRRTLREIRAADPEFLVINGDFVDRALPADFALAKRILDEELAGELPYYYVPGNHEIMGAPIGNFEAVFGETRRVIDHKGTRIVTLNSATGLLRSEFDQLRMLRGALDEAARDPSVESVVVMHHHPPRDITPAAPSQLADRKEAALLEQWLADFQLTSGKEALFIGAHAGYFHGSRVDGVPYLIVGNSGKAPATPPGEGGFTGWAMVDPEGVRAQVRPHVDALTVAAPQSALLGVQVPVTATLVQGGVPVPAAWPVSVAWSGSPGVHVGPESGVLPRHVAWFDPATGELTALRSFGTVVLSATVNGETASARIRLTAP